MLYASARLRPTNPLSSRAKCLITSLSLSLYKSEKRCLIVIAEALRKVLVKLKSAEYIYKRQRQKNSMSIINFKKFSSLS